MFGEEDIDDELGDDQLPLGLSHQLGQLILGAAQHFNAENHNLDVNFFAPVFGGDEDFGMNPGEEDMYLFDSDSDSYMDDGDDSIQQIFTTLGDSHVIRRLSFHKNVKNPRVTSQSEHCYEEIYRLLEEMELLCKVWRRRVEHPFTAHIAPHSPPPVLSTESYLREGEDYNSSDYEYDSEEEEDYDQLPPGGVNETLTKKKFCQSAKVFHQIFFSIKQFETFQRYVSKMKKYIFCVIFQLFLDALPPATRYSIPQELWEKIWKFTQNSYFRYKCSVPLCLDTTYYKAGLRSSSSSSPSSACLELERIRDMFGALGDIHMLVFEVLFKNPHILQPSPMFELEAEGSGDEHCRSVWKEASQCARTAFIRMQQLDLLLGDQMEGGADCAVDEGERGHVNLAVQLDTGCVAIKDVTLQLAQCGYILDPAASVIVSQSVCPLLCLPGRYNMEGDRLGLVLVLVEVERGEVVQIIETGYSYESHLIDVGSHRVRRKGGQGWKKHFCLTKDRITFLARSVNSEQDKVKLWTYPVAGEGKIMAALPPLVDAVLATSTTSSQFRHSTLVSVSHTSTGVLLVHQSPYTTFSTVSVYCLSSGEMVLNMCWEEDISLLSAIPSTRALLRSSTNSSVMLFSLQSGEVIQTWQESDLNTELGLNRSSCWSGVFDSCQGANQVLLHTHTLSGYKLVEFSLDNEMARPKVILTGQIVEGMTGLGPSTCLVKGVLFTNTRREMVGLEGGEAGILRCHQVVGYSLAQRSKHSVLCMGSDRRMEGETLLNNVSRRWWDEPGSRAEGSWDPERRPVFMLRESIAGVLLEVGNVVRVMDIGQSAKWVGEREQEQLWFEQEKERKAREKSELEIKKLAQQSEKSKKRKEEESERKFDLEREFLETGVTVQGSVVDWRGTYGFAKSRGRVALLGRVFFHLTDVLNKPDRKKFLNKGTKLEYTLCKGREEGTYKATMVRILPKKLEVDDEATNSIE